MALRFAVIALVLLTVVSGCIGQQAAGNSDISIRAIADPDHIKPEESIRLYVNAENIGQKDLSNVTIDVFDTGLLKITEPLPDACIAKIARLKPAQIETAECSLSIAHPENLLRQTTPSDIEFRTTFDGTISDTVEFSVLTLDEFRRRERIGELVRKPDTYTFADGQLKAVLSLGKSPPFIAGDVVIAQLNIRNVGQGYIGTLYPDRFSIALSEGSENLELPQKNAIFNCAFDSPIYSLNGIFPPITCTFRAPSDLYIAATYPATISVGYNYELRKSVPVTLEK